MTKVVNLRLKGSMQGDGGFVNLKNLYYLSCNTLDNPEIVKYGKARIHRELSDMWVDGKMSYGGFEFKSDEPSLTQSAASLKAHVKVSIHINLKVSIKPFD